ncbi:MAG TPA: class I SAM-dependent methyltransferase [Vicinamibacterales bacterium]
MWRKLALRNLTASDNHRQLDRLYALPDPWDMKSAREQHRCEMTNGIIESRMGRVGSILELGCGEGHQSRHLASLCDQLYGLDVSPRAIARAQKHVPEARFEVGTLPTVPWTPAGGRFDLVVACEVLYYVSDVPAVISRMSELGHGCLVTFFSPSAGLVAGHVDGLKGVERGWFHHAPYAWLWAFWRPDHH